MTRDEHRKACIETAAKARFALHAKITGAGINTTWESLADDIRQRYIELETAAFDALHGIAKVCPVDAEWPADLTNPPEKKP